MTQKASDLRRVISSTAIYALAGLAQRGLAFVLLPVYTRFLDPSQYGTLELLTAFTAFAFAVLMMGLPSAVNKVYHRDTVTEDQQHRVTSTALLLGIPVMVFGVLLLSLASREISRILIGDEGAADLVKLAVAGGALSSASAIALASLRASERAAVYTALTVSQFGIAMVLNILFVVRYELGVHGVLWGNLISHALVFMASLVVVLSSSNLRPSRQLAIPLLRFGLLLVPVMLCGWVIDLSDRYVLRLFSGLDEVAVYGVGYKIGMILQIAIVWPFQLAWPAVAFSISKREDYRGTYARTLTYFTAVLVFSATGLSLASRMGVPFLVGPGFEEAASIVPWIALAQIFNGLYFCMSPGVHVAGRTKIFLPLSVIAAALNLALNLVLVPAYGMFGAAWATVAAFFVLMAGTWFVGQRSHRVDYEYGRLIRIALAGIAVYGVGLQFPDKVALVPILGSTVFVLVGFPLTLAALGFLNRGEKVALEKAIHRLG